MQFNNSLAKLLQKLMNRPTVSCEGCPCYLHKEYLGVPFRRDQRANYCAHPAYIESYGIEQWLGATDIGCAINTQNCPLVNDVDDKDLNEDLGPLTAMELHGPELSRVSRLRDLPDHPVWKVFTKRLFPNEKSQD
jgi:hypothetical protein